VAAIALSTRSQCNINLQLYRTAEEDATAALEILTGHVESLSRRATSRKAIGKLEEAKKGKHIQNTVHYKAN
jgi:hypothetical protein